jgi:hypothetical protein
LHGGHDEGIVLTFRLTGIGFDVARISASHERRCSNAGDIHLGVGQRNFEVTDDAWTSRAIARPGWTPAGDQRR